MLYLPLKIFDIDINDSYNEKKIPFIIFCLRNVIFKINKTQFSKVCLYCLFNFINITFVIFAPKTLKNMKKPIKSTYIHFLRFFVFFLCSERNFAIFLS